MEFKQYPNYKDSGVEWLGEIPSEWDANRLKQYLIERNEKNIPVKTDSLLSVTMYQGVIPVSEKQGNGGNKPKENLENYKISYPNDIVLNSMNVIVGSVGLNKYFGLISPAYYALYKRSQDNNIHFFSYIFQDPFFQKSLFGLGNGILYKESEEGKLNTIRLKIPMEKLNQVILPLPTVNEQNKIVAFLDAETTRIDNLIAKQEKLIELLEEQRKSIISHAVTKGLNPDAPMKDSGVEWLGEVPEYWISASIKYLCKIDTGNKDTVDALDDGIYPFFVRSKKIETINEYAFDGEAVLTAGDGAGVGKIYHYINGKFNYHQRVYKMSHFTKVNGKFFFFYFSSLFEKVALDGGAKSTVDSLRKSHFDKFIMTIPTPREQNEIVQYLDNENAKFDALVNTQNELIQKLKEYRSSIISHAVTGKIDVREIAV